MKYIRYSSPFNDFQFASQSRYKKVVQWESAAYISDQIKLLIKQDTLYAAMADPSKLIDIIIGAPAEEVWDYMKINITISYPQKNKWYCVTYSLVSALDYVGNYDHIISMILKLAPSIDGKDFKYQEDMIKSTYNYAFKHD